MKKRIKNTHRNQRGLTLISWMVLIVFLLFQAIIIMNIAPVYLTDLTVKSVLNELPNDKGLNDLTRKKLKNIVAKRLNINSVYSVNAEDIKVRKGRDKYAITVDYEPRGTIIGNLEYIVHFKHEVKMSAR